MEWFGPPAIGPGPNPDVVLVEPWLDTEGHIGEDRDAKPADIARRFWRRLVDPALEPHERLFFELYGQALRGDKEAMPLLDRTVEAWLPPLTDLVTRLGVPPVRRQRPCSPGPGGHPWTTARLSRDRRPQGRRPRDVARCRELRTYGVGGQSVYQCPDPARPSMGHL